MGREEAESRVRTLRNAVGYNGWLEVCMARDRALLKDSQTMNCRELAEKYGISRGRAWQIARRGISKAARES
jgi:Mor family transcriptional regulator